MRHYLLEEIFNARQDTQRVSKNSTKEVESTEEDIKHMERNIETRLKRTNG